MSSIRYTTKEAVAVRTIVEDRLELACRLVEFGIEERNAGAMYRGPESNGKSAESMRLRRGCPSSMS